MDESTMSLEVTVFAMRLTSNLVERVSEVTIFVPSDRTTRSKGVIKKANGRLVGRISRSTYRWSMVDGLTQCIR